MDFIGPVKYRVEIIYSDDDMIVINKPSGLRSIPDRYDLKLVNLKELIEKQFGKTFVVHRLDVETSGLICYAFKTESHKELNQQFENRKIDKRYLAFIKGKPEAESGEINAPLKLTNSGKVVVSKDGKESVTKYKVIEQFKGVCLVEAVILTGRTHQIRVHFNHMGNPLLVDQLYAGYREVLLSQFKLNYRKKLDKAESPLVKRLTLHASNLTVSHPQSKEKLSFEAPLPKDLSYLLKQLRKYAIYNEQ